MTERSILIHAPRDAVYPLIADPIRMAQWSPECVRCRWVGRAGDARVGARFRGDEPQRLAPLENDVDDRRRARW
jgi:uncharacterized protein YndB with AHSA1/START domain